MNNIIYAIEKYYSALFNQHNFIEKKKKKKEIKPYLTLSPFNFK